GEPAARFARDAYPRPGCMLKRRREEVVLWRLRQADRQAEQRHVREVPQCLAGVTKAGHVAMDVTKVPSGDGVLSEEAKPAYRTIAFVGGLLVIGAVLGIWISGMRASAAQPPPMQGISSLTISDPALQRIDNRLD